ncbi:hypothetical protein PEC18_36765 [Paucibacter sp. O1-1]|nr:hypothetical protein [Paucibacter sp. O1-1]MDA3831206.1 hypothetical protein [Paucibacter sp. O1-1]
MIASPALPARPLRVRRRRGFVAGERWRSNKQDETFRKDWNQFVNGREREALLDRAASISMDVMQDRTRLRDAGRGTGLSVLDAEVEYCGVLTNCVNARNDTLGSDRLLAASGALTPTAQGLHNDTFSLPIRPLVLDCGRWTACPDDRPRPATEC